MGNDCKQKERTKFNAIEERIIGAQNMVEKRACLRNWKVCDRVEMTLPGERRQKRIEECVDRGVAF